VAAGVLDRLRRIVGPAHVLTEQDDGDLSAWTLDWRRRYRGRALAVVRPGNTEEVAAVLAMASELGVAVVPQGGNTGLVGGGVPDASGTQMLLSMQRLNRIRGIDAANLTLTAEAGCILQAVQQAAEAAGLMFPLSLAAEGSCTIGGNLATNAGGTQVLRWGNARELCLGLEFVTSQGRIWHGLTGLRKDNTGYDLRDLFIGSEGTLGVITAATMKLAPQPAAVCTALVACADLPAAVALLELSRRMLGDGLSGFEVMNVLSRRLVARHFPNLPQPLSDASWSVLLEYSSSESEAHGQGRFETLLGAALERGIALDAVIAASLAQTRALWHLRESIPLAQAEEGPNIKHDISLPVSAVPSFVAECDAALQCGWPGVGVVDFGHLGDGNLHYNVQAPSGTPGSEFLRAHEKAINASVFDLVARHGGSFSAEHGIGALKRDELATRKDPVALALMRSIKSALDPLGILNPGRVL